MALSSGSEKIPRTGPSGIAVRGPRNLASELFGLLERGIHGFRRHVERDFGPRLVSELPDATGNALAVHRFDHPVTHRIAGIDLPPEELARTDCERSPFSPITSNHTTGCCIGYLLFIASGAAHRAASDSSNIMHRGS